MSRPGRLPEPGVVAPTGAHDERARNRAGTSGRYGGRARGVVGATRRRRVLALGAVLLAGGTLAVPASADDSAPVRLNVTAPAVARLDRPLTVSVHVEADAGALDYPDGPLRLRVKLAPECGGSFAGTQGPAIVDAALPVQPTAGEPLKTDVSGSGRPSAYGVQAVCVFLESTNDSRQYVTDVDTQVDVSQPCTAAARRYAGAKAALKTSKKALATARTARKRARTSAARATADRTVTRRRRTAVRRQHAVATDLATAKKACGTGVAL